MVEAHTGLKGVVVTVVLMFIRSHTYFVSLTGKL